MSFEKQRKWKQPDAAPEAGPAAGQTVMSLAGRDKGSIYTVLDTYTDKYGRDFARLTDENRPESKPKIKNLKQLAPMPYDHQSRRQAKINREG